MSPFLIICGVGAAFALALLRALAMDEVRGRIQRRVEASVEATISSLPLELQEEWADEWRAELAVMKSMPLSAVAFARGLRRTALQLAGASELAPVRVGSADKTSWLQRDRFGRIASSFSSSKTLALLKKRRETALGVFLVGALWAFQIYLPLGTLITLGVSIALGFVLGLVLVRER